MKIMLLIAKHVTHGVKLLVYIASTFHATCVVGCLDFIVFCKGQLLVHLSTLVTPKWLEVLTKGGIIVICHLDCNN